MNTIKTCIFAALVSGVALKADNHSEALWLMLAKGCDQYTITQYEELTLDNFLVTDAEDKSIYDIALGKHKETGSIPCARMAVFFMEQEKELRKKYQEEVAQKLQHLDEVEKKFENPHQ